MAMKWLILLALSLCGAAAAPAQGTVFIVRHAEKATGASENQKDPALSLDGKARATRLAAVLRDAHVGSIYASEFQRTQQTAAAVGQEIDVETTIVPADKTAALVEKLRTSESNSLVVAHSNTAVEIIKALGVSEAITIAENDYDNFFIVTFCPAPRLTRLHLP